MPTLKRGVPRYFFTSTKAFRLQILQVHPVQTHSHLQSQCGMLVDLWAHLPLLITFVLCHRKLPKLDRYPQDAANKKRRKIIRYYNTLGFYMKVFKKIASNKNAVCVGKERIEKVEVVIRKAQEIKF